MNRIRLSICVAIISVILTGCFGYGETMARGGREKTIHRFMNTNKDKSLVVVEVNEIYYEIGNDSQAWFDKAYGLYEIIYGNGQKDVLIINTLGKPEITDGKTVK